MRCLVLTLAFSIVLTGCAGTKHTEHKQHAELQWKQVRGRVKLQLASQQYEAGLFDECISTASESLALDPACVGAHTLLARANLELGKPASAQRVIDSARGTGLTSAELLYTEGVLLEQGHQIEQALAKFAESLIQDSNYVDALVAQVECLVALNRTQEAWDLLHNCRAGFDDQATVAALTAHVAILLGRHEEAVQKLTDALAAVGKDRKVAEQLGLLLVRLRRYAEALPVLSRLIQDVENTEVSGAMRRGLAECYLETGDAQAAQVALDVYAHTHPEDAWAQLLLAKAAIATGDFATARRAVSAAEARKPHDPEVRFVRAVIEYQRRSYVDAKAALESVLTTRPSDADARCLLGDILLAEQDVQAADEQFRLALQTDPDNTWAKKGMAQTQTQNQR